MGKLLDSQLAYYRDTWAEINLEHISYNIEEMKRHIGEGVKVFAVVKANAYGHGDEEVAKEALNSGASYLAVAFLDEALALRRKGIRPFGLVKVKIETAGSSGEAEAVLTAISKSQATIIQQALSSAKDETSIDEQEVVKENKEIILYQITPKELFLLASTSGGVGVVISAVIAFIFQFEEIIPYEKVFNGLEDFISSGVLVVSLLVFIGFLVAWAAALIGTMLKYAGFTVKKNKDDFIITRGLLEKRQLTIPSHLIQAIRLSENLIRQPLGLSTVYIESAGGSECSRGIMRSSINDTPRAKSYFRNDGGSEGTVC